MEIQSAVGLLANLAGGLPMLVASIIVVATFLVWKRTRSTHSLMARLWRLFYGNKECRDPTIQKFLDEQAAFMEFRFTTGVRVRTQKQAHAVIAWARQHEENIGDIAACGPYFDVEEVALKNKLPGARSIIARFILAGFLALVTILCGYGAGTDEALLRMKKSGVYFFLSADYARPLLAGGGLSKAQCRDGKVPPTEAFSMSDAEIICEIFNNSDLVSYLQKTVKDQRIAFGLLFLFLVGCSWVISNKIIQGIAAHDMRNRLTERNRQLQLALDHEQSEVG